MQTKQSKLISIAVLAITLFSGQLFGMDTDANLNLLQKFYDLESALTFQADNPEQPIAIDLGFKNIGAEGARAIANALKENNTTLETINLAVNNIGDEGAFAIADALKENTTLKSINLEDNWIDDEGAKAIAKALEKNTTLKSINLQYNWIDDEVTRAIAGKLRSNRDL